MPTPTNGQPSAVQIAVANDFEVIVRGLAAMLDNDDRVHVVELAASEPVTSPVDVVLFDTFGHGPRPFEDLLSVVQHPLASRVAVYSWSFDDQAIDKALDAGASGFLSKALGADDLVDALLRIHKGEVVVSEAPDARAKRPDVARWPGDDLGLTEREAEVLTLITRGLNNAEIADTLFLSINSIKTHIRKLYSKIDARDRSQALLFGIDHGFRPRARSIWWDR